MRNWIILIILFFFLGAFLWQGIYLPKDFFGKEKIFLVEKGQGFLQIAENLEKEGLIKNKYFLFLYIFLKGKQRKLQAGRYSLTSSLDMAHIAKKIISGKTLKIKVTFPEGFTLNQIENKLNLNSQKLNLHQFLIKEFKEEFDFLKHAPDGACLEGFLFPDTYFLASDIEEKEMARIFLKNFNKKLTSKCPEWKRQEKSIFEIVTMASLLEKEVKTKEDKKLVSGILWKRLKNRIPLQVDASITYLTGKKTTKISKLETQIDSPYNTYKYLGLPIGPICNPGVDSIKAALYPENSKYWYYLSTPEGETIFSQTLEQHNLAKVQ